MMPDHQNEGDYRAVLVDQWIDQACKDLEAARINFHGGRFANTVRGIYFACFHVVSAFFMKEGKALRKHSQFRAAFRRELITPGRIDVSWGPFHEWVLDHREQADYQPFVVFDSEEVEAILDQAETFISDMKKLLQNSNGHTLKP